MTAVFFPEEILPAGDMAGKRDWVTVPAREKAIHGGSSPGGLYFAWRKCAEEDADFYIAYFQ